MYTNLALKFFEAIILQWQCDIFYISFCFQDTAEDK